MSSPFDVRGVTSRNISPDNGAESSSSEMPPPLPGVTGDGTSAAAILPDVNQTMEETNSDLGASPTGIDGRAHTPPVLTPLVPSGETTSGRNGPQDNAMARILADVTDRLGALEDVLHTQRQAYPLQS